MRNIRPNAVAAIILLGVITWHAIYQGYTEIGGAGVAGLIILAKNLIDTE